MSAKYLLVGQKHQGGGGGFWKMWILNASFFERVALFAETEIDNLLSNFTWSKMKSTTIEHYQEQSTSLFYQPLVCLPPFDTPVIFWNPHRIMHYLFFPSCIPKPKKWKVIYLDVAGSVSEETLARTWIDSLSPSQPFKKDFAGVRNIIKCIVNSTVLFPLSS
jgi:hypothetical protein